MTTIRGDFNHVTAEGNFLGDLRMADGPVHPGDLITVVDLFSDDREQGRVAEVTADGAVVVAFRVDSFLTISHGDNRLNLSNNRVVTPSFEASSLRLPDLVA